MNYFYEALDESGKTVLGKIDAANEAEVQQRLLQLGYRPQSIAPNPAAPLTNAPTPLAVQNGPDLAVQGADRARFLELNQNPPTMQGSLTTMGQSAVAAQTAPRAVGITRAGNAARTVAKQGQIKTAPTQTPFATTPVPAGSTLGDVKTKELQLFFQQLASLVRSGMTVYASLDNLAARTRNPNLAITVREMAQQAHTGGRISDVMEHYAHIYPAHITGKIRAGELGGYLEIAIAEIADDYKANIGLYRTAWIPKLMAVQALFLLAFAQPLFPSLFNSLDLRANIELYLRTVFLRNLPLAFGVWGLAKVGSGVLQRPQYRHLRDSWSLRVRPFGELQRQVALANFLRTLRRLYASGVAPIQAWEGAMNTASNVVIRDQLASAYSLMQQGASLPEAFAATGLFADSVEQLVLTGHQSGDMVAMLDQAIEHYEHGAEDASRKARFMMLRFGILAMLILGGAAVIWMAHTYFHGMFDFVDKNFGPDGE
jgi:type IV pilus assembly protein PilC